MSIPLSEPSVGSHDVVETRLTEIVCVCDYGCAIHLDQDGCPDYWQCPDCGKSWSREHIIKLRRLIASGWQDMGHMDENHTIAHKRHFVLYRFTDPEAQTILDAEVKRMEAIKGATDFKSYLHEIGERLKVWEKATDAKAAKNLTKAT